MPPRDHPIWQESLPALRERAAAALRGFGPGFQEWCARLRPADGTPGRFRWALQTTRDANVAATAYLLGGLKKMGLYDRVITPRDREAGIAWVRAMNQGHEQYRDPALLDRPTPGWPKDQPWPNVAMLNGVNCYARSVLGGYGADLAELPPEEPPAGWPQPNEPDKALEFIRTRPWATNPWGAGSHAMRMARWLLQWHRRGLLPLDPAVEALRFFYRTQNPATGLWGGEQTPMYERINGTFKLFPYMRDHLDLPLPHADKIIDQVLSEFYRPDYDAKVGGCDEWDNWYVIALAVDHAPGHRTEEIQRLAAWRIVRIVELFRRDDGGLSYAPGGCCTNWIGYDMAPACRQSDVMGPGILTGPINVCIDLTRLQHGTPWTGVWRMHERVSLDDPLRQEILRRLRADGTLA